MKKCRKTLKSILAVVLAVLMLLPVVPVMASAAETKASGENEVGFVQFFQNIFNELRAMIDKITGFFENLFGGSKEKEHEYDDGVVISEPTCLEYGMIIYTCRHCDATYTEFIPKEEHNFENGIVTTPATCATYGVKTFLCSNNCGTTYTEIVEKIPHEYNEGIITTYPTCIAEGVKTYSCTNGCGAAYTEAVEKLQHEYRKVAITKKATCTEEGVMTYSCINGCGGSYTEAIEKLQHDYSKVTITKEATCTEEGERTFTCIYDCGASYSEVVEKLPAKGHSYVSLSVIPATSTEYGKAQLQCTNCNHTDEITLCSHAKTKISTDEITHCSVAGCQGQFPPFNAIVNALKATEAITGKKQMFTGVYEDIDHQDEIKYKGTLGSTMDKVPESTTVRYSRGTNGFISNSNFPADNADFVSTLTDKDVKSIKIEKVTNVKPLSPLPDKYTSGSREYSLVTLKAKTLDEAYKITVVLNNETSDINKAITGTSPYDKIYAANYNNNLEALRAEIAKGFNDISGTIPSDVVTKYNTSGTIGSNLTVEYYIDVNTYAPLAAKYAYRFDTAFNIDMAIVYNGALDTLNMEQSMYMQSNSYYLFGAV